MFNRTTVQCRSRKKSLSYHDGRWLPRAVTWRQDQRVSEPSGFFFKLGSIGELMRQRLIGVSINSCVLPSYIVTDQKALTGGSWPLAKVSV